MSVRQPARMPALSRRSRILVSLAVVLVLALIIGLGALSTPAHAGGGSAGTGAKPTYSDKNYDYYLTGNAADVIVPTTPAAPMLVLMGGGTDVDDAFRAMIAKARGNSGQKIDIVIVRASGADGYNPYLYTLDGANSVVDSVETVVVKTRAGAESAAVSDIVKKADVLFIAGGDQYDYISLWKGTLLETTLKALSARNVPFGGTSAGLSVLGEVDYSAQYGTIISTDALNNPYNRRLTLDNGFLKALPYLTGTITEPHFVTRDRMGRLLAFVARMIKDGLVSVDAARAIGVDEQTALVIDGGGTGTGVVLGIGAVYFLKPSIAATTIAPRTPLTFKSVGTYKVTAANGGFSLNGGTPTGAQIYNLDVISGVLTSSQGNNSPY